MYTSFHSGGEHQQKIEGLFRRFFGEAAQQNSPEVCRFYRLGSAHLESDTIDTISAELGEVECQLPRQGSVHLLKGHLAIQNNNLDQAIQEYEAAVQGEQSSLTHGGYECLFALGAAHFRKGNYVAAAEAFAQCSHDQSNTYYERVSRFYSESMKPSLPFLDGVCQVSVRDGCGTGFAVSDRIIITCEHVVRGAAEATVRFYGDTAELHAQVIKRDATYDIAALRLDQKIPQGCYPLKLGKTAKTTGHTIYAFGYPYRRGLWGKGEVIGVNRDREPHTLQIKSKEITHGFSGGPVWDAKTKKVIGMVARGLNIAYYREEQRFAEVQFAIPIEAIKNFIPPAFPIGCFIATAACGEEAPETVRLRRFRDEYLQKRRIGRLFISLYYRFSPRVALFIADKGTLKAIIRGVIRMALRFSSIRRLR
ncbi:MAG: hypothetical protein B6244_06260 [Candidatus Cloacimonetes bacterium 4572_55]|nr:MAG: hypothetical protein B6244_06260 [Candidatus Cloacimonetes bacterium 4572_55]